MLDSAAFIATPGKPFDLARHPTRIDPICASKHDEDKLLEHHVKRLDECQRLQYAANRHAILLIFQAMDAAGKDGAIRHVLSGVNPQGCQVFSYQHPSANELQHDFLWRTTRDLPERGRIGIFNRSYYEEVLIVRVHPDLLQAEALAEPVGQAEAFWQGRYRSIIGLERHLHDNGTRVVKIFLHLSKDEQRKRFLDRIDDPTKNWKFTESDMVERGFWDAYQAAYQACIAATSTVEAPWYVVPADDKVTARLIVSQILLDTFDSLDMRYPMVSPERRAELMKIRKSLEA
ncbi:polyphosphate kinase 2 family protein [bacterium]|nr:polyphosphate kinase 2 family protein [bacterium]